jgi:hypothetical protein
LERIERKRTLLNFYARSVFSNLFCASSCDYNVATLLAFANPSRGFLTYIRVLRFCVLLSLDLIRKDVFVVPKVPLRVSPADFISVVEFA